MINKLIQFFILSLVVLLLVGCGGGGTGNTSNSNTSTSSSSSSGSPSASNVVPIIIDSGPSGVSGIHNIPYISIKICAPGSTSNCQTIDHIQVDTGSTGLRLLAEALPATLNNALTTQKLNNATVSECMQYFDGYAWGPLKQADITIGNYSINTMTLQIIGDSTYASSVPSNCANSGRSENTIATFGAKGIIGIGNPLTDCGSICAQNANTLYYTCASPSTCQANSVPLTQQMQNPVSLLATDNNGSLLQFPALTNGVGTNVSGSLIFGINTSTNNALGNATVLTVDPNNNYYLTAQLQSSTYTQVGIDSGTTDWVFDDNGLMPTCTSGFYCPTSNQIFTAILNGVNGSAFNFSFTIGNAQTLSQANPNATAFSNFGVPAKDTQSGLTPHTTFLIGLPFFFGRNVWTSMENKSITGTQVPFIAFN